MPVITTYASMSSRGFAPSNGTTALSSTYARYLPTTGNVNTQIRVQRSPTFFAGQQTIDSTRFSYSTDGKLYVIAWIQGGSTNEPLIITKYLSNNYFGGAKTVLLSDQIYSGTILCDGNNIYVVTSSITGVLSVIKFDSDLNILWNTFYSEVGVSAQQGISITIDSTSTYLYISSIAASGTVRRFYIFQNNGTLINAYNANSWFDSPNSLAFDSFSTTRIIANNGATFFDLTGLTSVSFVSTKKTGSSSNQYINPVCYYINGSTRYSYSCFYYNGTGAAKYLGIIKRDFNGNVVLSYRYVFSTLTTGSYFFQGITATDTNVYAYITDFGTTDNVMYIIKFDTNLNYINGYKLSTPVASGSPLNTYTPNLNPNYFNNTLTSLGLNSVWRLPNDLSLLANGTYVVDGVTWTKSTYSGTVTRFNYTVSLTTTTPAITTVTPTLVSFTPTVTATTDSFTYVGL